MSSKSTAVSLMAGLDSLTPEQLEKIIAQSQKTLKIQHKRNARTELEEEKRMAAEDEERFRQEELAEMNDDPEAHEDEQEWELIPKKRKAPAKGSKDKGGSYWRQSDEEGPQSSDEEIEVPQPKKARGSQILIKTPTKLATKLPPRRGHARSASTASSITAISSPVRHVPTSSDPPETPTSLERTVKGLFTPYSKERSCFSTQGKQSPPSKGLLDTAYHHFRLKIALEEAFPSDALRTQMAKASFIEACQEDNIPRRLERFKADTTYVKQMSVSVGERASQLRGEVKTKAQNIVSAQYGLSTLSKEDVKAEIIRFTTRGTFHFRDTKGRKGMFENAIIPMVLADQWFKRKSAEGAGKYSKHFNPCPIPLIALVVTAVECALNDYESGVYCTTGNQFFAQEYTQVYQKHIGGLEKYQKKAPALFAELQSKLWLDSWRIAGRIPPKGDEADSDLDEDDFAEIVQKESGAASS